MEFKSLTNIETGFRRIRLMLAVFIGCCTLVTGYALWSSFHFAEKQREKIYVLDGGANYRCHSRLSVLTNDVEGQDSGLSLYFDLQPAGFLVLAVRNREGVDTGAILKGLDRVCSCDMDE